MNVLRLATCFALLCAACSLDSDDGQDLAATEQDLSFGLTVHITSGPPADTNQTSATFTYTASRKSTFFCALDAGAYASCPTTGLTVNVSNGVHTFMVYARSGGQNSASASYTWTVDTMAPVVAITSRPPDPSDQSQASFAFTCSDPSATTTCALDAGPRVACTSPVSYAGLAQGAHVFQATCTDGAGNSSSASYTWTIDAVAPVVTFVSGPTSPTNQTTATFVFTSNDPTAMLQCALDGGPYTACLSPVSYSGLANGAHTFVVRATDAAGNSSTASDSFVVDTVPPSLVITSMPPDPTSNPFATFTFAVNEPGSTIRCALDGSAFVACASPTSYMGLANGAHTFYVMAFDQAGNAASAAYSWTIGL